jgi:hypothetical protein
MERLTNKDFNAEYVFPACCSANELDSHRAHFNEDLGIVEDLAGLVKAKQEGRVAILPCKLGTQIFAVYNGEIIEHDVAYIVTDICGDITLGCIYATDHVLSEEYLSDCIGSTLFLTRAEAEAALQERREQA